MSATLNPLIVVEKAWKEDAPKQELIAYVKVSNSNEKKKIVNFIPIDDGSRGIEHLVGHTMKQFDRQDDGQDSIAAMIARAMAMHIVTAVETQTKISS